MNFYADNLQYFIKICFYLGPDWRVNQNESSNYTTITLINPNYRFINIIAKPEKGGLIRLFGGPNRKVYEYGNSAKCNFSRSRSPLSVAGDIKRKILPHVIKLNGEAKEYTEREKKLKERDLILKDLLSKVAKVRFGGYNQFCEIYGAGFRGDVSKRYGNHFDLSLNGLTMDQLIKVAAFVGQLEGEE
ncbi:hypothetical protein ACSZN3_21565 [Aeromonas hydrophila]|uniref:hypothetical protein n=1 Tax=Aeromonas hydrophila TaxID=644 RepID=UPI003EC87664